MQKTFLVKNSHLKNFGPYAKLHRKPQIQGQGIIREVAVKAGVPAATSLKMCTQ